MLLCDTVHAEESVSVNRVICNQTTLTSSDGIIWSGTVSSSSVLDFKFYSNQDTSKDLRVQGSVTLTYPQVYSGKYLVTTPYLQTNSITYLSNIGSCIYNGYSSNYMTQEQIASHYPFSYSHGGYVTSQAGTLNIAFDFTYPAQNTTTAYNGLSMSSFNASGDSVAFASSTYTVTVNLSQLSLVDSATIENAETTKNIWEWLQDGFVDLFLPTYDGFNDMIDEVNSQLNTDGGILLLPFNFFSQCIQSVNDVLGGTLSASFTLPKLELNINGTEYRLWNDTTIDLNSGFVAHLFSLTAFVLFVQCGTLYFILRVAKRFGEDVAFNLYHSNDVDEGVDG